MATTDPRLRSAVEGIVRQVQPETVFLFGSRARGDADDASDWDLFVVLPDNAPPGIATPSTLWRAAAIADLPVHAVACRRGVFEAKRNDPNSLSHDVARDGVVTLAAGRMNDAARWIAGADTDIDAVRRCLAEPPNLTDATIIASKRPRNSSRRCWSRCVSHIHAADQVMTSDRRLRSFRWTQAAADCASFDTIADWSISFRYPADDPAGRAAAGSRRSGGLASAHRRCPCRSRIIACFTSQADQ